MVTVFAGLLTIIVAQVEGAALSQGDWTFPDGAIGAVVPSGFQTAEVEKTGTGAMQGFRWVDAQTGNVITAYQIQLPQEHHNKPVNINEFIRGFNEAFMKSGPWQINESSSEIVNGFPIVSINATSKSGDLIVKQRMAVTSTSVYVLAATGTSHAQRDDARLQQFVNSLKVMPTAVAPPPAIPGQPRTEEDRWNEIGGKLGFLGGLILVACVLLMRQSRHKSKRQKAP